MRHFLICILAFVGTAAVAHAQVDSAEELAPPAAGEAGTVDSGTVEDVVIDLSVTSTPQGAQVIVDRRVVGITPLDTQLAIPADATTVRVTIQADGYQPRTREVAPRGGTVVMDAALAPLPQAGGGSSAPAWGATTGTAPVGGSAGQPAPEPAALRPRHVFGAGLGFFTINNDTPNKITALTLTLDGSFRLMGEDAQGELTMDLLARWSFVSLFFGDEDPEARPNNPTVGLMLGSQFGPMRVYGGPGVTLPVAAAIEESSFGALLGVAAHGIAGSMRGYREPWEFLYSHMGFHARVGTEARFDVGHVGAEMALGFAPGIEANYNDVPNFFGWQLRLFGAARPVPVFSVGGEVAVVYLRDVESDSFSGSTVDQTYVSVEPYVRFHFGAAFLGYRFLLNLTDNIGFSFDDGGIWSMTLEGGVALE